jgi:peptide/nickel transport system substrate-binding protein
MNTHVYRRRRTIWAAMAGLLLTALVAAACGSAPAAPSAPASEATSAPAAGAPAQEKVLIVAVDGDIDTFDPCCTVGTKTSQTTIQNTFDQLTQYAQIEKTLPDGSKYMTIDTSKIEGMLAESWSQDGNVVTFKLRPGLTYHNGDPVNAEAIVEGYRRIFEVQGVSSFLLSMGSVNSPDAFKAVDEYTVQMTMETPNNLVNLNNVMHNTSSINPKEVEQRKTDADPWAADYFKKNLAIGNGPFIMEEYVPGDRIVLRANKDYYLGAPKLDRVIVKIVPDPAQRVLLLKRGEVDMIMIPPVKDLDALDADPNIKVVSVPSTQNRMLEMNVTIPPFDNVKLRQAVAHAVPYDTLIEKVWLGRGQRLKSPIANGTPTSDFSHWTYEYDVEQAKALLAEAGFPEGQGLPPIKLSIRIGTEEDERAAVFIQDALAQIGMQVEIEKLAFATFQEQEAKRQLQFFIDEWISWVNDPFYHLSWIYRSDSPTVYTNYNNPQVDELINTYTLWAGDEAEREQASKDIQKLVVEDVPVVYLLAPNFNVAMRENVSGYVYYNDELNRYYYMDKE